jgi:hypothetical protein
MAWKVVAMRQRRLAVKFIALHSADGSAIRGSSINYDMERLTTVEKGFQNSGVIATTFTSIRPYRNPSYREHSVLTRDISGPAYATPGRLTIRNASGNAQATTANRTFPPTRETRVKYRKIPLLGRRDRDACPALFLRLGW